MAAKVYLDANVLIDAVQYYSAIQCGANYIITRNERDYPQTTITIISPSEFLRLSNVE